MRLVYITLPEGFTIVKSEDYFFCKMFGLKEGIC